MRQLFPCSETKKSLQQETAVCTPECPATLSSALVGLNALRICHSFLIFALLNDASFSGFEVCVGDDGGEWKRRGQSAWKEYHEMQSTKLFHERDPITAAPRCYLDANTLGLKLPILSKYFLIPNL